MLHGEPPISPPFQEETAQCPECGLCVFVEDGAYYTWYDEQCKTPFCSEHCRDKEEEENDWEFEEGYEIEDLFELINKSRDKQ